MSFYPWRAMTPNEPGTERERVQPELVPDLNGAGGGEEAASEPRSAEEVTHPTKLIRIASMVRSMLEEVRRAPLDDAGRKALREIHEKSVDELEDVISPELREELAEVSLPFSSPAPSESELRLAQAQLVGWLEGLFHGIQATLFTQQAIAQQQLEEMRRRPAIGRGPAGPAAAGDAGPGKPPSGYL